MKKVADKIKRVGVLGNCEKQSFSELVREAAALIDSAGRVLCLDESTAQEANVAGEVFKDAATLANSVDMLLVFGGDGTILRVARETAACRTPILGVNIGSLGFLTAVPSAELAPALARVWKGEFWHEQRALLQVRGCCNGTTVDETALNDIVVSRGIASRLIELDVHVDGDLLTRYRCDGLILSSATGSTAYSLAAGGAVVFPTADVLGITPICPHTLSNRSLVLPLSSTISVRVASEKLSTILNADGLMISEMAPGDQITVRRSRRAVCLMHLAGSSFCDTLRRKLHWRGAATL